MQNNNHNIFAISDENHTLGTLHLDGVSYKTVLTKKYANRKLYSNDNANKVSTKIPGTIVSINVSEGDFVNAGDVICILDSMKMNNNIRSPFNGTIKQIFVKQGDVINKGTNIVEFDLAETYTDVPSDDEDDILDEITDIENIDIEEYIDDEDINNQQEVNQ